ncbi:MAG: phosphoenolpyruvate carboxykinase domain-containing protein, partial [Verrucomicrobiota bacterium]
HMSDYFNHWLNIRRDLTDCPRIFHVNWFRKTEDDKFLWPGFGENFRVLRWIINRCRGRAKALETQIGWMPRYEEFDWSGLDFPRESFEQCMKIDGAEWHRELISQTELFLTLHDRLPKELIFQRELLISRL